MKASGQPAEVPTKRPGRGRRRGQETLLAALIVGPTLAAYVPAMRGEFIWDDVNYIHKDTYMPTARIIQAEDGLVKNSRPPQEQLSQIANHLIPTQPHCKIFGPSGMHIEG